jgi:hypothetical protein
VAIGAIGKRGVGDVQPTDRQNEQQRDLLTHGDLKPPDGSDRERCYQQIGGYVQTCVCVVHAYIASKYSRVLVNAFRKRSFRKVPVRIQRKASKYGTDNANESASEAKGHGSVYGYPHLRVSEDAAILPQD